VIAFFWGDSAVYGWWIGADSVHAARLGAADSLAVLMDFLHGTIERPETGTAWRAAAARAYRELVAPLAPDDATELFAITDGPLARVPLEVFLPDGSAPPWGGTRRIIYGPSASVLLALARAGRQERWTRGALVVGDPAVRLFTPDNGGDVEGALLRSESLHPLPFAEQEARAVRDIFRADGADLLLGRDATVKKWLALEPARYRVLHFASHARVDDRHPERTALLLSDGGLDLARIRALDLDAELVTLSGCETALGERVRGEGIIGLPHAFLAAGARGAVVSLWRVADRSTSRFMEDFYAGMRRGESPAAALLEARRIRIGAGIEESHPSRWAAFVLVGGVE
jgi:CHAT domain-containing protein